MNESLTLLNDHNEKTYLMNPSSKSDQYQNNAVSCSLDVSIYHHATSSNKMSKSGE